MPVPKTQLERICQYKNSVSRKIHLDQRLRQFGDGHPGHLVHLHVLPAVEKEVGKFVRFRNLAKAVGWKCQVFLRGEDRKEGRKGMKRGK
jgi:hypothetical protein